MNADTAESFARLASALTVLAAFKIGRGGWYRMRQSLVRAVSPTKRRRGSSSAAGPEPAKKFRSARERRQALARELAVALWIALLLLALAYVAVRGESALADLDEARLLADF